MKVPELAEGLNAVLKLDGSDCIDHVTFENTAVSNAFAKNIIKYSHLPKEKVLELRDSQATFDAKK